MKCGKCGQELRETDKFCPECGTPVEQTAPTDEINAAKTEQQMEQSQQLDYVVCSNCKRLYKAVHTTCPYCNTAPTPPEPKICPKCGTENDPNADYCYKCFTVFSEQKKPEIDYTNFYKLNKFAIVIGALIIIAIIIYGVSASRCSKSSPALKSNYSSNSSSSDYSSEKSTKKPTEKLTEKPTEKLTENVTDKVTEKITEPPAQKIKNNTSSNGFWAEGSGDYVVENLNVTNYAVLHITHSGSSNFAVKLYKDDKYEDLLVNTIGDYSGDVLVEDSGKYELEITADGNWNITSDGLSVDDTTSFSGTGDGVTGITSHSGGNWHITNSGSSNFVVIQYGESLGYMELLVNEIGNYDGTVKVESGDNIFFKVTSEGSWTIKKK